MKIFALVTIYNRGHLLLPFLKCVYQQTYTDFELVIVDDNSTDGSVKLIKKGYPETTVIETQGNLWWSGGMNKGLEYIMKNAKDDDVVIMLNDDTEFSDSFFNDLLGWHIKKPNSCIGTLSRLKSNMEVYDSGMLLNWDGYLYNKIDYNSKKDCVNVDVLPGRGVLVPIEVFKKIGFFNNSWLPQRAGDYDFFIRANRAGYNLIVVYDVVTYAFESVKNSVIFFSLYYRMFNKKSESRLLNTYYMIIKHSPSCLLKLKNLVRYTFRSLRKV